MPTNYYTSLSNLYSSTWNSVLSFFIPSLSQHEINFSNRKRSKFGSNKTASLALPDTTTTKQSIAGNSIFNDYDKTHFYKEKTKNIEAKKKV